MNPLEDESDIRVSRVYTVPRCCVRPFLAS